MAHRTLVYYTRTSERPYGSAYFLPLELCSTQYVSLEYTLNTPQKAPRRFTPAGGFFLQYHWPDYTNLGVSRDVVKSLDTSLV